MWWGIGLRRGQRTPLWTEALRKPLWIHRLSVAIIFYLSGPEYNFLCKYIVKRKHLPRMPGNHRHLASVFFCLITVKDERTPLVYVGNIAQPAPTGWSSIMDAQGTNHVEMVICLFPTLLVFSKSLFSTSVPPTPSRVLFSVWPLQHPKQTPPVSQPPPVLHITQNREHSPGLYLL